ncbi:MAG: C40 family peptidase [Gammaproteobacteria bacterium]|nr:C40 family peptidase [Gammaproteobacteria bacterium]
MSTKAGERRSAFILLPLLAIMLALSACGGGGATRTERLPAEPSSISAERQRLLAITRELIGAPYRFGGNSPARGFDCSGLVHYSYRRLGVPVARTVRQQRRQAQSVASTDLLPGDLVFFDTRAKNGHVGIYLGNGRFIHAPSTGGYVREERLDQPYWRRRWLGGGSLLDG